jgi:hypothetical protein
MKEIIELAESRGGENSQRAVLKTSGENNERWVGIGMKN